MQNVALPEQNIAYRTKEILMNNLKVLGKFLDQPRLVGKFSKKVPAILIGGGVAMSAHHAKQAPDGQKKYSFIKDMSVLTGTIGSALISTRGIKKLGLKGLSQNIDLNKLAKNNTELINDFVKNNDVTKETAKILEKAKTKVLNFSEVKKVMTELKDNEKGQEFIQKLIPDPENITSKEIFGEIKRLSIMGLVPVVGGISGGIVGDKLTDKNWKDKIPNKIKEGTYQYLANIFLCNVGAGAALGVLEKMKITSKAARAVGMITGIITTGIIGGSAIANKISKAVIDPLLDKNYNHKTQCKDLYSERKPEMLDIGLHADDIATVAVLSGLKWIEPALPILYSISGYRAGIGYRNGDNSNCKRSVCNKIA